MSTAKRREMENNLEMEAGGGLLEEPDDEAGDGLGLGEVKDELPGDEVVATREAAEQTPRFEGGVLVLPTRARDFRMVSVE